MNLNFGGDDPYIIFTPALGDLKGPLKDISRDTRGNTYCLFHSMAAMCFWVSLCFSFKMNSKASLYISRRTA